MLLMDVMKYHFIIQQLKINVLNNVMMIKYMYLIQHYGNVMKEFVQMLQDIHIENRRILNNVLLIVHIYIILMYRFKITFVLRQINVPMNQFIK